MGSFIFRDNKDNKAMCSLKKDKFVETLLCIYNLKDHRCSREDITIHQPYFIVSFNSGIFKLLIISKTLL